MGVRASLAALAIFTAAGSCGRLFTRGAGTAILFGGATDVGKAETEETEAEEDGFHESKMKAAGLTADKLKDATAWQDIPKQDKNLGFKRFSRNGFG